MYRESYPRVLWHFLKLYFLDGYGREDVFGFGVADPALSPERQSRMLSPNRAMAMQKAINPRGYDYVTEDKGVFYLYCMGAGIPIPRLYAILDPILGWAPEGSRLGCREDWYAFFRTELPREFVIKPNWGVRGEAVSLFARCGKGFADHKGRHFTTSELVDTFLSHKRFDRFIVQERLRNHPDLVELTEAEGLHTVRIITGVDAEGQVRILFAVQKLVGPESFVDTFDMGRSGNLAAQLDLETGRVVNAIAKSRDGVGMSPAETYPKTGRRLLDFQVPRWDEVKSLAVESARKFLPIRTVGWDIAVTPDRLVIVEGNLWWGPPWHCLMSDAGPFLSYAADMMGTEGKGRLPDREEIRLH